MPTIDEQRRLISSKLKELTDAGTSSVAEEAVAEFDPPMKKPIEKEGSPENKVKPIVADSVSHEELSSLQKGLSMEEYRSLYFQPSRSGERRSIGLNADTLEVLRNVLSDLGERTALSSYIDRILREHLLEHQELLNNACSKRRRKTTIQL